MLAELLKQGSLKLMLGIGVIVFASAGVGASAAMLYVHSQTGSSKTDTQLSAAVGMSSTTTSATSTPAATASASSEKISSIATPKTTTTQKTSTINNKTTVTVSASAEQIQNAQDAIVQAQNAVRAQIRDSYLVSTNAVDNGADQLLNSPTSENPTLKFNLPDQDLTNQIQAQQDSINVQTSLVAWGKVVMASSFNSAANTSSLASTAETNLTNVLNFLTLLQKVINEATSFGVLTKSAGSADASLISSDNIQVSNALASVIAAETQEQQARAALATLTAK